MRKGTAADCLLSLFTSRERSTAILGDLCEQGRDSWFNILRTAGALFLRSVAAKPIQLLLLVLLGLTFREIAVWTPTISKHLGIGVFPVGLYRIWVMILAPAVIGCVVACLARGCETTTCLVLAAVHPLLFFIYVVYESAANPIMAKHALSLSYTVTIPSIVLLAAGLFTRKIRLVS